MHRNLVIVRAGDESMHTSFLGEESQRNWDIFVSFYGKDPNLFRDRGQVREDDPRLPFPAIYDLIGRKQEEWKQRYDYIWFCCDDIVTDMARVNRFFDICREYALELAQPALTLDSRIYHMITAVNKAFRLRYTTYVESMCPCFSVDFLLRCRDSFALNVTGHGVDYLWPTWASHLSKIAVVDATPMRHMRSRGPLYEAFKEVAAVPEDDLKKIVLGQAIPPIQMTVGGVDITGRLHAIWNSGHRTLIQALMAGYLPEFANHPDVIYRAIEPVFQILGHTDFTDMASLRRRI
jgi:hypothetical protein